MKRRSLSGALVALFLATLPAQASAAVTLLNHDTSVTTSTTAVCLAAPDQETGSVVVQRIRLTLSRSTGTTYTFVHSRSADGVLNTEDVSSCVAPGCATVFVVEGVSAGQVFDARNLSLELPPGSRL